MKHLILVSCLAFLLVGCVSNAAFKEEKELARSLQMQQQQLSAQIEQLRSDYMRDRSLLVKYGMETEAMKSQFSAIDSLSKQFNKISDIVKSIDNSGQSLNTIASDLKFMIDRISTLQDEFADNTRTLIDMKRDYDNKHAIGAEKMAQLSNEIIAMKKGVPVVTKDPESKVNQPVKTEAPKTTPPPSTPKPTPAPSATKPNPAQLSNTVPKASSATEQNDYNSAKIAYDRNQFDKAIVLFEDFLRKYPEQPLAVNAHYWIGESHYGLNDFSEAYRKFRMISTTYTGTVKAADALVKMAMCNWKMGNFSGARQDLNQVKSVYPDYERMSLVNRLLTEIPK